MYMYISLSRSLPPSLSCSFSLSFSISLSLSLYAHPLGGEAGVETIVGDQQRLLLLKPAEYLWRVKL